MIPDLLFLLFSAGILAGGSLVALGKNPMVGILGMLLAFLNGSGLFILLGAEFLGLLLIMVYVGAVAVMFLFVLMTIDIDFSALREGWAPYLPLGLVTVGGLATLLILAVQGTTLNVGTPISNPEAPQNIIALGQVLFTQYAIPFQIAGLLLLVAMIGAIGLTHRPSRTIKRQDVTAQITRKRTDAMVLTNPATGQGAGVSHWVGKGVEKKKS